MLEFNAGIVCCELPIGFGVVFVAVFFPSRDFFDEGLPVGNAAVEALGQRDAEFGFGRPLTRSANIGFGSFWRAFWGSMVVVWSARCRRRKASSRKRQGQVWGVAGDFQACIQSDQGWIPSQGGG
jgi:hypothetical protein